MPEVIDRNTGEIVFWTEEAWNAERDLRLMAWEAAKRAIETAKEAEMTARKAAVDFCFDQERRTGTERIELGNGYEAKAVKKQNHNFVKGADGKTIDLVALRAALAEIATLGNEGPFLAERIVKWSPDLVIGEYNNLAPQYKAIIDKVIVTTDGAPMLEIIAPKTKAA